MKVKFWGTRGSVPTPGETTLRYGGNTSCVEVITSSNIRLILDAGTGLRLLGQEIIDHEKQPIRGHILITHTHWDHIQGLPFFAPLFIPGCEWDIYAPLGFEKSLKETLAGQMQYSYFPVTLDQLGANIHYHELVEGQFNIGDIKIKTQYLNHAALTLGYRMEADGVSVVYATDHEPYSSKAAIDCLMDQREQHHIDFLSNADLVIHDAQYISKEYDAKKGWGHSTIEYSVEICCKAGVKTLVLTHHEPTRSDDALDEIVATMRKRIKDKGLSLKLIAASEGEVITLEEASQKNLPTDASKLTALDPPLMKLNQSVLLGINDSTTAEKLLEAVQVHGITVDHKNSEVSILKAVAEKPSLVILENDPPSMDGINMSRTIRQKYSLPSDFPIVLISDQEEFVQKSSSEQLEWLVKPFSVGYARSFIQAKLLKKSFRWLKALIPFDENQRLEHLQKLNILDSPDEERFDRLTRITAVLFDVPMVAVSLIDKDRQWFKSAQNCSFRESSREVSFCAHVIVKRQPIVVPDTLIDERFADNPSVLGDPHVRFYAGYPLILKDGVCIGTLCLVDIRPRQFDDSKISLLKDMSDLVIQEISR